MHWKCLELGGWLKKRILIERSKIMLLFSFSWSYSKIRNKCKMWVQHGLWLFRIILMQVLCSRTESDVCLRFTERNILLWTKTISKSSRCAAEWKQIRGLFVELSVHSSVSRFTFSLLKSNKQCPVFKNRDRNGRATDQIRLHWFKIWVKARAESTIPV